MYFVINPKNRFSALNKKPGTALTHTLPGFFPVLFKNKALRN